MSSTCILPALCDIQVNGYAGVDFWQFPVDLAGMRRAVSELRRGYVYRILLTLGTDTIDRTCAKLALLETLRADDPVIAETIAGYHIEGPWLSTELGYRGAHSSDLMCLPQVGDFDRLDQAARGAIRLITIAPELPGSVELIRAAVARRKVVALGHTNASYEEIDDAIEAGASLCTHLGNAVPDCLPRHDNIVQRLLSRDELTACFIPDGIHLPPFVLRNFVRAKPKGKVLLTTDAMAAAGAFAGNYTIGATQVSVGSDGIVRAFGQPNFAGSALSLYDGVRNAAGWLGLSFEETWALGSTVPAELFGIKMPMISVSGANLPCRPRSLTHDLLSIA